TGHSLRWETHNRQWEIPGKIEVNVASGEVHRDSAITYKLITGINETWGYDILVDGRVKIHQPSVPCLQGNEGFMDTDR
ncbi:MAG: DUF4907 domain-containing protein, partial [Bacteroidales bacterium]|nr:DUF4907 domain-containing protein [Bacteroidales bacterium]